jgi:hypothetical protein
LDLDQVDALGGVAVNSVISGKGGYNIVPGPENESVQKNATTFLTRNSEKINKLINEFGGFSAKELELRSTIHYVYKENKKITNEDLIKTVKEIKPKFSAEEISFSIKELIEKGLITLNY